MDQGNASRAQRNLHLLRVYFNPFLVGSLIEKIKLYLFSCSLFAISFLEAEATETLNFQTIAHGSMENQGISTLEKNS